MTMNDPVRFGILGCGTIAPTHALAIVAAGNGVLAGIYPLCELTDEPFHGSDYKFTDLGNGVCEIAFDALVFSFTPESCSVRHPNGVKLKKVVGRRSEMPDADCPVRAVPYRVFNLMN